MKQNTIVIHGGSERHAHGAIVEPICRSTTFRFDTVDEFGARVADILGGKRDAYVYTRVGNPTNAALEHRMAILEGAESCVVTASGIGAVSAVMWTFLKQGDHLLADAALYGDTHAFFGEVLAKFGVDVTFVDFTDLALVKSSIKPTTRLVYFESPCNPTLKVIDISSISTIVREQRSDIRVVIDNTFASPFLQTPLNLGADIVVHSMTKYLGGHCDAVGGCVCGSKVDILKVLLEGIEYATGAVMAPDNAALILRGIETLSVRMERHCENALTIARYLEGVPHVDRVYYPGLSSHAGHVIAMKQMRAFGGMIAAELHGSLETTKAFVNALKLVQLAVSLGGVQSLIVHPASMTHANLSPDTLAAAGISPTLVRISIGIEDSGDLIEDFQQAFEAA